MCAIAQTCTELASAGPADLVRYLNRDRSTQTSLCVEYALRELGEQRYLEGIQVVLRHFDFQRDLTPSEIGGVTNINRGFLYPATSALFGMGKPALPYILDLLAAETNALRRRNALEAVRDICRDDYVAGVRLVRSAAEKVRGDDARLTQAEIRLNEASRELAMMCPPQVRSSCEAALYDTAPAEKR